MCSSSYQSASAIPDDDAITRFDRTLERHDIPVLPHIGRNRITGQYWRRKSGIETAD
jgi:hypothetical protein